MSDPREYTEEEVRDRLLKHIWGLVSYWENVPHIPIREKMEGLAFSILSTLDGSSIALPKFVVAPDPHPEDKSFHQDNGESWFPENHEADVVCDLGGSLHELFHQTKP